MSTFFYYAASSLFFGALFNLSYRFLNTQTRLTLRGRRVLFVVGLIVGAGVYYFDSHIFWECSRVACGYRDDGGL